MLIGRKKEIQLLNDALQEDSSQFIAVYGRRRIGKTYLIDETYREVMLFHTTGIYKKPLKMQLEQFAASLKEAGFETDKKIKNYFEAFELLKDLIRSSDAPKKVIFLDELSWMDVKDSNLLSVIEAFWNGWASARKDVVLVVCASATSWILDKVIHDKGGLYNRLTCQIRLDQLTLGECEKLLESRGIVFNRPQILECYMIMGGVPYYWTLLKKGLSLAQNIDALFFSKNAVLKEEYNYLYRSIFNSPAQYMRIVEALCKKKSGMTRRELLKKTGIANSGSFTKKLEELENCGFIRKYAEFGKKKKDAVFQIMDNFTLFYFRFMQDNPDDTSFWSNQINTPKVNNWRGLAFERVCLQHVPQIKKALGISGVQTNVHVWYREPDEELKLPGVQIDLLIVRKDQIINLCEMKYSTGKYKISKVISENLDQKINTFAAYANPQEAVHLTMITPYGIDENTYAGSVQASITGEDLFA